MTPRNPGVNCSHRVDKLHGNRAGVHMCRLELS